MHGGMEKDEQFVLDVHEHFKVTPMGLRRWMEHMRAGLEEALPEDGGCERAGEIKALLLDWCWDLFVFFFFVLFFIFYVLYFIFFFYFLFSFFFFLFSFFFFLLSFYFHFIYLFTLFNLISFHFISFNFMLCYVMLFYIVLFYFCMYVFICLFVCLFVCFIYLLFIFNNDLFLTLFL